MKTVSAIRKQTLLDYISIELFIAENGNKIYLCLKVEELELKDKFLCIEISKDKFIRLISGKEDLRDLFTNSNKFYITELDESNDLIDLELLDIIEVPEKWLPEKGIKLEE